MDVLKHLLVLPSRDKEKITRGLEALHKKLG